MNNQGQASKLKDPPSNYVKDGFTIALVSQYNVLHLLLYNGADGKDKEEPYTDQDDIRSTCKEVSEDSKLNTKKGLYEPFRHLRPVVQSPVKLIVD